jgi:mono/diheme cytochrome c family protein
MQPISSRRLSNIRIDALRSLALAALLAGVAAPALAEDAPDTAKLWTKHCQSCHGPDGKGRTKAGEKAKVRDLSAAEVKAALTKEKAVEAIRVGVKEKDSDKMAMKGYSDKLSDAEIQALAEHSLSFK